jgi:hypothetical protein
MQLRRSGLLLPLMLLALAGGCSRPEAVLPPDEPTSLQPAPEKGPSALERPTANLQPVQSLPALQRTPESRGPGGSTTEIIQTYYRPAGSEPNLTVDSKSGTKLEFGRAANYEWLQGELIYSSVRGVWRLRYASSDEDDAYGGSVTLLDVSHTFALEAGQRVRVRGRLINPRSTEPSPYYHVLHLEPLGTP